MSRPERQPPPQLFLLLQNPKKSTNLGPILRCACAFGITTIVAVGYSQCSVEGSHGASKNVDIIAFPVLEQAVAFLAGECNCTRLIGLLEPIAGGFDPKGYPVYLQEDTHIVDTRRRDYPQQLNHLPIIGQSFPSLSHTFRRENTCIVLHRGKGGFPQDLALTCHEFIHIAHPEIGLKTKFELLDTQSCLSILLHDFTTAMGYDERTFQGHKFDIERPGLNVQDKNGNMNAERRRRREENKLQLEIEDTKDGIMLGGFFGVDAEGDY